MILANSQFSENSKFLTVCKGVRSGAIVSPGTLASIGKISIDFSISERLKARSNLLIIVLIKLDMLDGYTTSFITGASLPLFYVYPK